MALKIRGKGTTETPTEATITRTVETTRSDSYVTVYANNANVETSRWDIRIRLGQIDSATDEKVRINELASVYMSVEHARAFLKALTKAVERYDKTFAASVADNS